MDEELKTKVNDLASHLDREDSLGFFAAVDPRPRRSAIYPKLKGDSEMFKGRQFIQNPECLTRLELEGDTLVFHIETGFIHVLNNTGLLLWQQCAEASKYDDLLAKLIERFPDIPRDQIDEDVETFLGDMVERELLLMPTESTGKKVTI